MTVLCLDGEHDIATLPLVTELLAGAIATGDTEVVVDLSGVTFIGAATIDELIRSRNRLWLQSRTLTLRSPSRFARRVLDLCGLTDLVEP
jgi:anti-sigma B factor antagonist